MARCAFEDLCFFRPNYHPREDQVDEAYLIAVPNLTYREIRHLDTQLPIEDCRDLKAPAIPEEDLEKYKQIYRYFPTFAEAEI
jgi:hypothetical protein